MRAAPGFHLLDALAARGIFRKYELVLELGAGLGAASRWLAARLGCEVVGTTTDGDEATVGGRPHAARRAGGAGAFVPARRTRCPFRRTVHARLGRGEPRPIRGRRRARSPRRSASLRRGGTFAMQELVMADPGSVVIPGWRVVRARTERRARTRRFRRPRNARSHRRGAASARRRCVAARAQLARRIAATRRSRPSAPNATRSSGARSGAVRVVQLLAHRRDPRRPIGRYVSSSVSHLRKPAGGRQRAIASRRSSARSAYVSSAR
jgi:hypothetical protein